MTKDQYYQQRYEYWIKAYSSPGTRVLNMSIEQAADKTAKDETEKWWLKQMGPQLKVCCNTFLEEIKYDQGLQVQLPSEVYIYDGIPGKDTVKFCPFCGTKVEPQSYSSPQDNPFN